MDGPTGQYFAYLGALAYRVIHEAIVESQASLLGTIISFGIIYTIIKNIGENPLYHFARYMTLVCIVHFGIFRYSENVTIKTFNSKENNRYATCFAQVAPELGNAEVPKIPFAFYNAVQAFVNKIVGRINGSYATNGDLGSVFYKLKQKNLFNMSFDGKNLGAEMSDFYYRHYLPHVREYITINKIKDPKKIREYLIYPNDEILSWMETMGEDNQIYQDDYNLWRGKNDNLGMSLEDAMLDYGKQLSKFTGHLDPSFFNKLQNPKNIVIHQMWQSLPLSAPEIQKTTSSGMLRSDDSIMGRVRAGFRNRFNWLTSSLFEIILNTAYDYFPAFQSISLLFLFLGLGIILPLLYWPGMFSKLMSAWFMSVAFFLSWDIGWSILDWAIKGGVDVYRMITGKEDMFLFSSIATLSLATGDSPGAFLMVMALAKISVPILIGAIMYGSGIMMAGAIHQMGGMAMAATQTGMQMGTSIGGKVASSIGSSVNTLGSSMNSMIKTLQNIDKNTSKK